MSDLVQRVPPVVRARALVKRFRSLVALDGVDLEAEAGECVGVLGPSGSGKSVLVRALYGRVLPDSGSVRIFGLDVARQPRRVRAGLGVVPQDDDLDPSGTVRGELRLHGRCFGLPASESRTRIEEILAFVGIEDRRGRPIADLSPGTRRRAALARALLHAPSLLLADEPSMGLPPSERRAPSTGLGQCEGEAFSGSRSATPSFPDRNHPPANADPRRPCRPRRPCGGGPGRAES